MKPHSDSLPCFPLQWAKTQRVLTQSPYWTKRRRHDIPGDRAHSVVGLAPYGLTATTASSSVDGLCRDVTVTHSPGFTVLIAANPLSGTLMRIVMYGLGASVDTSSAGRTRFSSILRPVSARRTWRTASL